MVILVGKDRPQAHHSGNGRFWSWLQLLSGSAFQSHDSHVIIKITVSTKSEFVCLVFAK